MFVFSLDGTVFVNARALEDANLEGLAARPSTFVGVALTGAEVCELRKALRDASSGAAAHISGKRWKRSR